MFNCEEMYRKILEMLTDLKVVKIIPTVVLCLCSKYFYGIFLVVFGKKEFNPILVPLPLPPSRFFLYFGKSSFILLQFSLFLHILTKFG